jgi:hypothetical protein
MAVGARNGKMFNSPKMRTKIASQWRATPSVMRIMHKRRWILFDGTTDKFTIPLAFLGLLSA